MKCIETFKSREAAGEGQRRLKERGIESRVAVDPLDSMHPALGHFQGVALMVQEEKVREALAILRETPKVVKAAC